MIDTYVEHNLREHRRLIRSFQGVRETLRSLHEREFRLGIVTSKAKRGTGASLEACDLPSDWFEDDRHLRRADPAQARPGADHTGARARRGLARAGDLHRGQRVGPQGRSGGRNAHRGGTLGAPSTPSCSAPRSRTPCSTRSATC